MAVNSTIGTRTYTTSGTYVDSLVNVNGCDSVVTTYLMLNGSSSTQTVTACGSYNWMGNVLALTANYMDTIPNALGCDSLMTLELTINPFPNSTVTVNNFVATAADSVGTYQWIDCNNGNAPIAGAIQQSFTATVNGSYAVIVTSNGCSDTSSCVAIIVTGIDGESSSPHGAVINPNPNNGVFDLRWENVQGTLDIRVFSADGQLIIEKIKVSDKTVSLDMEKEPVGIYYLKVVGSGFTQTLKVIKQ